MKGEAKVLGQGGDGGRSKTPCEQTHYIRVCELVLGVLSANGRVCKLESSRNLERIKTLLTTKAVNFMSQSRVSCL